MARITASAKNSSPSCVTTPLHLPAFDDQIHDFRIEMDFAPPVQDGFPDAADDSRKPVGTDVRAGIDENVRIGPVLYEIPQDFADVPRVFWSGCRACRRKRSPRRLPRNNSWNPDPPTTSSKGTQCLFCGNPRPLPRSRTTGLIPFSSNASAPKYPAGPAPTTSAFLAKVATGFNASFREPPDSNSGSPSETLSR